MKRIKVYLPNSLFARMPGRVGNVWLVTPSLLWRRRLFRFSIVAVIILAVWGVCGRRCRSPFSASSLHPDCAADTATLMTKLPLWVSEAQADGEGVGVILMWTPWFRKWRSWWNNRVIESCDFTRWSAFDLMRPHVPGAISDADLTAALETIQYGRPGRCVVTHDRAWSCSATSVVFHVPDTSSSDMPVALKQLEHQSWVLYSAEAPVNDPHVMFDAALLRLFDQSMTYRLDSDYPHTYFGPEAVEAMRRPYVPLRERSENAPFQPSASVLWIASNCKAKNHRHAYIRELMRYIPVDSVGKCMRNRPWPADDLGAVDVMRQYQFYLAMENSNCKDYVSEKTINVFQAGIVPIVDGPRDYSPFIPHPDAVIRLDDFESPKALAEYLISLIADEGKLVQRHMAYRQSGVLSPRMAALWQDPTNSSTPAGGTCKLCRDTHVRNMIKLMREKLPASNPVRMALDQHWSLRFSTSAVTPDQTCQLNKWAQFNP